MNKHWTDDKPHTWDYRADGRNLSDEQVAGKVRMLMRHDMDHEFVCTLARDRIASLSRWHDMLETFVQACALGEISGTNVKPRANELLNEITRQRCRVFFEWPSEGLFLDVYSNPQAQHKGEK